jgi:hypothetical protein
MRDSAVMISSTIPSTKYSCSGSPLILANGNTAMDGFSGSGSAGASVAGYSRLMGADEEGTHERLKALRHEQLDPKIPEHHGRTPAGVRL